MAMQRNVSAQNAESLAEIRRIAKDFVQDGARAQWLRGLLQSRNLSPEDGALVKLTSLPDQDGDLFSGLWLSETREFWEFTVLVPRSGHAFPEVESFTNITPAVAVSASMPGTGKSFGYLALQVLREMKGE